jgi:N-acetylglutamate synthase
MCAISTHLELLSANAWPAAEIVPLDGWRLRFTGGVTRRANSVWPNAHHGDALLDDKLAAVESFYAQRHAPVVYQICEAMRPAELDAVLEARGYTAHSHSLVQSAPIATLLEQLPPLRMYPDFEVEVSEEFDPVWFDLFCLSEEVDGHGAAMRRGILERIEPAHGFVLVRVGGEPAAVGLGVAEDGWVGVFSVATRPEFRRRGAARAIMRTLAIWGQLYGAQQVYLQVMVKNKVAQTLYASMGFTTAYQYHYREKA